MLLFQKPLYREMLRFAIESLCIVLVNKPCAILLPRVHFHKSYIINKHK